MQKHRFEDRLEDFLGFKIVRDDRVAPGTAEMRDDDGNTVAVITHIEPPPPRPPRSEVVARIDLTRMEAAMMEIARAQGFSFLMAELALATQRVRQAAIREGIGDAGDWIV